MKGCRVLVAFLVFFLSVSRCVVKGNKPLIVQGNKQKIEQKTNFNGGEKTKRKLSCLILLAATIMLFSANFASARNLKLEPATIYSASMVSLTDHFYSIIYQGNYRVIAQVHWVAPDKVVIDVVLHVLTTPKGSSIHYYPIENAQFDFANDFGSGDWSLSTQIGTATTNEYGRASFTATPAVLADSFMVKCIVLGGT